MISMHRSRFAALCRDRGAGIDAAMACVVSQDGDRLTIDERHEAYPRRGLGDMVAAGLSAVGVTKDRVEAVVGGPCGCGERQAWLNKVGHEWLGLPPGQPPPT